MNKDILSLEIRNKIFNYIKKNPGVHIRYIYSNLDIANSTGRYHLKYLEKRGLIIFKSSGKYVRCYISQDISETLKNILGFLRESTPKKILLYLLLTSIGSQKEISDELVKHPSTIHFHIKKLIEAGLIEVAPETDGFFETCYKEKYKFIKIKTEGREIFYRLTDPYKVYDSFLIYNKSISDDKMCRDLLRFFQRLTEYKGPQKSKRNFDDMEDLEDYLFYIFPNPYHV